jgi:subtilisin family serine protease
MSLLRRGVVPLTAALAAVFLAPVASAGGADPVEVVVRLDAPPLAAAIAQSRALTATARTRRLDLRTPTSVSYLAQLARTQSRLEARILRTIPQGRVRWHYRVVLDGFAVVVPRNRLHDLSTVPGVAGVYLGGTYRPLDDVSPHLIGADQLWGLPDFTSAGNGVKIGILDQGIDQQHPFFDATGYVYPPGFPKGDTRYTTPKVIVARAFASASSTSKYKDVPYDPVSSDHGDHVAGIAAGDYTVGAVAGRGPLAGVAPKAYLGNYKFTSLPTRCCDLDGNAPEIAAAIEAAVSDGMDVINISYGEPEVEPSRDVVVQAIEGAAAAGVATTVAAGNEFGSYGRGSISSPGNAPSAITAAAVDLNDVIASFSSSGPAPVSLQFKPDVSAPGDQILSSVPPREGTWFTESGTSMAAPHVAGAVALLRQRHPQWTVAQLKSALVLTGDPVYLDPSHTKEAPTTREGGGLIDLPHANVPLIFAAPTDLSFGLIRPGAQIARTIDLTDAGGGTGDWSVIVQPQQDAPGVTVAAPAAVAVPGSIEITASASADAAEIDATGFIVLQQGSVTRRVPYWLRVERPRLGKPSATLTRTGTYKGDTRGKPALVSSYRYPDNPIGSGVSNDMPGPEQLFRILITRNVANFGVAIVGQAGPTHVSPRIVTGGDENRLTGYPGLPGAINPYQGIFGAVDPVAGAILPLPGTYDAVFDTPSSARAGAFTFRFWIDDTTPPTARLVTRSVARGQALFVDLQDAGAGVDPASIEVTVDGRGVQPAYSAVSGRAGIPLAKSLAAGRHRLVVTVSDYQESKNMEDVGPLLPNTRTFRATFILRP